MIDSEQVFWHGTVGREPNSKPLGYNDNALESIGHKSGNGIVNEDENGVLCDLKGKEGDADQLSYAMNDEDGWNTAKLGCSMSVDDIKYGHECNVRDFVAPIASLQSSQKFESLQKDSIFYMDKSVLERELPELIVCYKDNTYHVVKDICIDEGVPSQDKFLFDTGVDEKNLCTFQMEEARVSLDLPIPDVLKSSAEKKKLDLPIPDMLKCSEEKESKYDFSLKCDSKDIPPTEKVIDHVANDAPKEIVSLEDLLMMPELGSKLSHPKSSGNNMDEVEQKSFQTPIENSILSMESACEKPQNGSEGAILASSTLVSAAEESHCNHEEAVPALDSAAEEADHSHEEEESVSPGQISVAGESDSNHEEAIHALDSVAEEADHGHEEATLVSPALISAAEESDNGNKEPKLTSNALDPVSEESTHRMVDEFAYNSKVEIRSITFDFDTSAPTASGIEKCPRNGGSEHLGTQDPSRLEDPNTNPVSSQPQYVNGESSFSAAGPLSGLISYSGPIAYSGSVSLRSDSSTTSTRSFAFPVLQSEWNSSPVRMAKADRRHFRKHRCWRPCLLCCRF